MNLRKSTKLLIEKEIRIANKDGKKDIITISDKITVIVQDLW